MDANKLLYHLRKWYPKSVGYPGDFIGIQTGKIKGDIKNIVVCLDFDNDVWDKIKNRKVDLILTHHPLIYGKRKEVLFYDPVKKQLVKTIDKLKIPVYSMHTNFDAGKDGMNDALANKLGLKHIHQLKCDRMFRGGYLEKEMEIHQFAKYAKEKLELDYVMVIARGKPKVKKIAICGGAAAGCFKMAQEEGYDVWLSGDAPHHIRHDVNCYKYNYIEIAHEVEKIFIPTIARRLKELDKSLNIITVDIQKLPDLI